MKGEQSRKVRYQRRCHFCGRIAFVLLPPGASKLDVEAEFSGQGRAFAYVEDDEPVGVGCHSCATSRMGNSRKRGT